MTVPSTKGKKINVHLTQLLQLMRTLSLRFLVWSGKYR